MDLVTWCFFEPSELSAVHIVGFSFDAAKTFCVERCVEINDLFSTYRETRRERGVAIEMKLEGELLDALN